MKNRVLFYPKDVQLWHRLSNIDIKDKAIPLDNNYRKYHLEQKEEKVKPFSLVQFNKFVEVVEFSFCKNKIISRISELSSIAFNLKKR